MSCTSQPRPALVVGFVTLACLCWIVAAPHRAARAQAPAGTARVAVGDPVAASAANTVPGEEEFNSCRKLPPGKRIKVSLKAEATIEELLRWLSRFTCKRFVVAQNLRHAKVTLVTPTAITATEAYRGFHAALEVMGLALVPAGRFLKIVPREWAMRGSIPVRRGSGGTRNEQVVTRIVRLNHIDARQLTPVVAKLKSKKGGDVTVYPPGNSLVITDSAANIARMMKIIAVLDRPLGGAKIWILRPRRAVAADAAKLIKQLFATKGRPGSVPAARKGLFKQVVVDPETNALIVVADRAGFRRVASLLRKLVVALGGGGGQGVHVYFLKNAAAAAVSQTMSSVIGGAARQRGRKPSAKTAGSPFEGQVQITADKANNALVVVASTRDFLALRKALQRLDIPRRQVFIEVSILEVSLDTQRKLGVAYHGGGTAGSGDSQAIIFGGAQHQQLGSLLLDPLAMMGLAAGARGAQIDGSAELLGLPADIPSFGVMFQALKTASGVNVLSSPHILTTDNEEAEITVGQNVPFQGAVLGGGFGAAASQAGGLGALASAVSVQRQDVALKLKLTPQVNDGDMVRIELDQEVSDIVSPNYNNLGPATSKRTAKTTVVVRNQQTVVIGGLISSRVQMSESKVPLLGDIPLLGRLFSHSSKTLMRTNLLIVLTPYVIVDQSDLRRIYRRKLRERREFLERYTAFSSRRPTHEIDYRHKRGLLAEINSVGAKVEREAKMLEDARERMSSGEGPESARALDGAAPASQPAAR